jgi:hypothetical protein
MDDSKIRVAMIAYLEGALECAEQLKDGTTAYLIERSLDEARGRLFSSIASVEEQLH